MDWSEEEAEHALRSLCACRLQCTWHENKHSFLSYSYKKGYIQLRLHRLFLKVPSSVFEAISRYVVKQDRSACAMIRKAAHGYFLENCVLQRSLAAQGKTYDLQIIYEKIKTLHFPLLQEVAIGWSSHIRTRKLRSITFGSFDVCRQQIRIHPLLDDALVPLYFIEFIIYHELIHVMFPARMDEKGRFRCHTREFRRLERQFPLYEAAKEWEKQSLTFFKKRMFYHGRA